MGLAVPHRYQPHPRRRVRRAGPPLRHASVARDPRPRADHHARPGRAPLSRPLAVAARRVRPADTPGLPLAGPGDRRPRRGRRVHRARTGRQSVLPQGTRDGRSVGGHPRRYRTADPTARGADRVSSSVNLGTPVRGAGRLHHDGFDGDSGSDTTQGDNTPRIWRTPEAPDLPHPRRRPVHVVCRAHRRGATRTRRTRRSTFDRPGGDRRCRHDRVRRGARLQCISRASTWSRPSGLGGNLSTPRNRSDRPARRHVPERGRRALCDPGGVTAARRIRMGPHAGGPVHTRTAVGHVDRHRSSRRNHDRRPPGRRELRGPRRYRCRRCSSLRRAAHER